MLNVLNYTSCSKRFSHQLLVVAIALCAGHFIVIHHTTKSWFSLLHQPPYYYSVISSALIAYGLISYIYWMTSRINIKENGFKLNMARVKKQLAYGFGGAVGIELIAASALYQFNNESLFSGAYFSQLFILIVLFIVMVNLAYCLYYAQLAMNKSRPIPEVATILKKEIRYKVLRPAPVKQQEGTADFPVLIYTLNKAPQAFDARGGFVNWNYNLKQSMEILPASDYFLINKNCIIYRGIVKNVMPHGNDCLLILTSLQLSKPLTTSRRKTTAFKQWLAQTD